MRINLVKYFFRNKKQSRIIFIRNFAFDERLLIILIAKMLVKLILMRFLSCDIKYIMKRFS